METQQMSLDHLNLTVRNFEESAKWYEKILGFEVVEKEFSGPNRTEPWGVLRSGNSMLCISEDPERVALEKGTTASERYHHIFHFGLCISNRDQWEKRLREERLETFYGSPVRYPHSTSWYIKDPTGYTIEIVHWDSERAKFDSI